MFVECVEIIVWLKSVFCTGKHHLAETCLRVRQTTQRYSKLPTNQSTNMRAKRESYTSKNNKNEIVRRDAKQILKSHWYDQKLIVITTQKDGNQKKVQYAQKYIHDRIRHYKAHRDIASIALAENPRFRLYGKKYLYRRVGNQKKDKYKTIALRSDGR